VDDGSGRAGGRGAAGELEEQQQQQRNESSKSAELEGITRRQYLFLFLFVFVVAWDYFGVGICVYELFLRRLEPSGLHQFLPLGPLRTRARRGRRDFRAPLHTFGGDDNGASSILVAFCFFRYTKESRTNERTDGRIHSKRRTTSEERTDEFNQNDERRAKNGRTNSIRTTNDERRTDGRIHSKRRTTSDERTDGFICGVSTVWSFVR
jgi:hypothetical protein